MPTMKMNPKSDCTLTALPVTKQHRQNADQAQRHDQHHGERHEKGLVQGHHQEVNQQRRQDQAHAQILEGILHARIFAGQDDLRPLP